MPCGLVKVHIYIVLTKKVENLYFLGIDFILRQTLPVPSTNRRPKRSHKDGVCLWNPPQFKPSSVLFFLGGRGVSRRVMIINCHGMSTTNSVGFTGKTLEYLGKINDLTDLTQTSFYLSVWENIDDLAKGVT